MSQNTQNPSREDVLDAFAVEPEHDRATIERYLSDYPEYTNDLIDLVRELSRSIESDDTALTLHEKKLIDDAWRGLAPIETKSALNPLASLTVGQSRQLSKSLNIPRQIITAFKECRVDVDTIPRSFLAAFADVMQVSVTTLTQNLSFSTSHVLARSYKSDIKPQATDKVSFEQLLIDAGVPKVRRQELLSQDD